MSCSEKKPIEDHDQHLDKDNINPNQESSDEETVSNSTDSTPPDWDENYSDEETSKDSCASFDEKVNMIRNSIETTNNFSNGTFSEATSSQNLKENMIGDVFQNELQKIIENSRTKYEAFSNMDDSRWIK